MPILHEPDFSADPRMAQLTCREREVLAYLVRGTQNKVIAAELGISQRTVETYRARLFRKMRVRNAVELLASLHAGRRPR